MNVNGICGVLFVRLTKIDKEGYHMQQAVWRWATDPSKMPRATRKPEPSI